MAKEIKSIIFEKYILFTIITLAVILLDQLVKWDIKKRSLNLPGPVIENFLSITNIHNYGASFGMLQNRPALLAWFSIFVVVLIFAFLGRADRKISIFLAMILGGIIGGVAGHQIGGGHGRDVATAVGAVIGAGVGNNATSRNRGQYERSGYETRCETVNDVDYEQRIDGYDVTYRYNGQIYQTRMPYDPGRRIPVNVDVRPAGY